MKKIVLLLLVSVFMIQDMDAQNPLKGKFRRFSVDVSGGIPVINGDIRNKLVGYDVAGRFNWNITSAVSIGTELGLGSVKGYESDNEFFTNNYAKVLIGGEVYLFDLFKFNQLSNWFQPFIGANVGAIKSDIEKSQSNFHYNDWTWAQQFNAGLKFKLTNMIDLNASANFMYTGTDKLDNYNPNVNNNKHRDALSTYRLGLTFHLGKKQNKSIIWKDAAMPMAVVEDDSLKLYTQNKMYELENKIIALERQNNKLNTKVVSSEKEVDNLEGKLDIVEKKTLDIEQKIENNNFAGAAVKPMETTVYFNSASDNVPYAQMSKLQNIANYLNANPNAIVVVSGYTDKVGDAKYNLQLSLKRAQEVRKQLIKMGVGSYSIETYGYGENHLLPDSDQGNRRVVLTVR